MMDPSGRTTSPSDWNPGESQTPPRSTIISRWSSRCSGGTVAVRWNHVVPHGGPHVSPIRKGSYARVRPALIEMGSPWPTTPGRLFNPSTVSVTGAHSTLRWHTVVVSAGRIFSARWRCTLSSRMGA